MTAARRYLPTDPADLARSLVPLALLAGAAALPALRIPVLAALILGAAVGIARGAPVRWAWAAGVPVAASLAWGGLVPSLAAVDGSDCANLASPIATWRLLEAAIVLPVLVAVAVPLGASRQSLGLVILALLGLFAVQAVGGFLQTHLLGVVSERVVAQLRGAVIVIGLGRWRGRRRQQKEARCSSTRSRAIRGSAGASRPRSRR